MALVNIPNVSRDTINSDITNAVRMTVFYMVKYEIFTNVRAEFLRQKSVCLGEISSQEVSVLHFYFFSPSKLQLVISKFK